MKSFAKKLAPAVNPSSSSSKAEVTESLYEAELGEARPVRSDGTPYLPAPLEGMVSDYLANDVNDNPRRYSKEHLAGFKLFGMPSAGTHQIAEQIGLGARTKALELIGRNPAKLHCVAEAQDGFGRAASGSLLYLAAAMGDFLLVAEMKKLLSEQEANALLHAGFSPGWEEEQKARDARYINAATQFRDRLLEKRLPKDMPYAQALEEQKASILELRVALRPTPNDPVTTRGFIVNPLIYQAVRELYLTSEADLGGYGSLEVDILWGGFQSLLGAGPPMLGQILIGGANKFGDRGYMPPEVLTFADGTQFYDPSPQSGLGATFIVSFWGDKYSAAALGAGMGGWVAGPVFLENLCRATTSIITELMQLPARQTITTTLAPR